MELSLNHPASNKTNAKSNNSAFFYFEFCQLPSLALLLLLIAYTIVLIVGLFGNLSLIIIIFKKHREAQNVTNILIANLSLSDILVCVMCIPFTVIYTLMDHWIFGDIMCKLTSYVQSVSISVSIFSLVLMAVERYQLIVNPHGWKPSVSHAYWGILLIWLFSLLLSVPFFLSYHLTNEPFHNLSLPTDLYTYRVACVENWPSRMNQLLFTTSLFMLQYCVPLSFILICYLKIVIYLRRRNVKVDKKRKSESRLSENKRISTMLISIAVTFGACWLPLNIFNVIFDWYHEVLMSCHHDLVFVVCHLVAMVSTCINPLFYGFLNKNFQKDLVMLIHHCWCFAPQERCDNIAISTMHTEESKGSLRLAYTSRGI
ncbi:LOW QUALITY PROTEIN: neuropeptide Y receptor type 6-like [Diceros bicornis minor]|uniref:LOW QUALITY PROTEIN: neuropeptide Y receptor type 6-like n=1 Tax=Diceros bicornis minor TaxID=77932 RepID=UPI0026F21AB5|nr:LOW QUALITY PROTEIN: neuropeptide Y receptor type 6-like [Diceros bicornis minor]